MKRRLPRPSRNQRDGGGSPPTPLQLVIACLENLGYVGIRKVRDFRSYSLVFPLRHWEDSGPLFCNDVDPMAEGQEIPAHEQNPLITYIPIYQSIPGSIAPGAS
jgi:hypothetical protein